MKALSINQPWAWAIVYGGKDIENRKWKTNFRGEFYIHAGLKYDKTGEIWLAKHFSNLYLNSFDRSKCKMGGIIGKANLVDCVNTSESPWFFGPYGFVLDYIREVEYIPCAGRLNFFVPIIRKD
jgi:hypothetical protein